MESEVGERNRVNNGFVKELLLYFRLFTSLIRLLLLAASTRLLNSLEPASLRLSPSLRQCCRFSFRVPRVRYSLPRTVLEMSHTISQEQASSVELLSQKVWLVRLKSKVRMLQSPTQSLALWLTMLDIIQFTEQLSLAQAMVSRKQVDVRFHRSKNLPLDCQIARLE